MIFPLTPRKEAAFREAKLPVAGLVSFRCQKCKQAIYTLQGRKRVYRGWHCAECKS